MTATLFVTQLQLMRKNMPPEALTGPFAQQQKMMLYLFPIIFAVGGINFPIGVLIYWLASNLWTMGQQFYVIRRNPAPGTPAYEAWEERRKEKQARKAARRGPAAGGGDGRGRSRRSRQRERERQLPGGGRRRPAGSAARGAPAAAEADPVSAQAVSRRSPHPSRSAAATLCRPARDHCQDRGPRPAVARRRNMTNTDQTMTDPGIADDDAPPSARRRRPSSRRSTRSRV